MSSGAEKIVSSIMSEAQAKANAIIQEAEEEAAGILKEGEKRAQMSVNAYSNQPGSRLI